MKNDKRKKNIAWTKNHRGEDVLELSVQWKDGTRYRRYMPNQTLANNTLTRIKAANLDGTWPQLKKELSARQPAPEAESSPKEGDLSIEEATQVYYDEWCLARHDAPDFDQKQLRTIVRILGARRLQDFKRSDAETYYRTRLNEVKVISANHGLTVLSGMLRWAWQDKRWIPYHPMADFDWLTPEAKKRFDLEDFEVIRIVERAMEINDVIGRLIGILAETALRIGEALQLKRQFFQVRKRKVVIEPSKHDKYGREVPLSPRAIELAAGLGVDFRTDLLFIEWGRKGPKGLHEKTIRRVLGEAAFRAGVREWRPTPHDLRHFRTTTWQENGIHPLVVRQWLGHKNLATTQIYSHYVDHRAMAAFDESIHSEQEKLARHQREETDGKWRKTGDGFALTR